MQHGDLYIEKGGYATLCMLLERHVKDDKWMASMWSADHQQPDEWHVETIGKAWTKIDDEHLIGTSVKAVESKFRKIGTLTLKEA